MTTMNNYFIFAKNDIVKRSMDQKREESATIQKHTEEFLAKGGSIVFLDTQIRSKEFMSNIGKKSLSIGTSKQ